MHPDAFSEFLARHADTGFVFVNDGNRDDTPRILRILTEKWPGRALTLDLPENRGKAEAARRGMLAAFAENLRCAGFWDADLATPLEEIPRFAEILERRPERDIVKFVQHFRQQFGRMLQVGVHHHRRVAARAVNI